MYAQLTEFHGPRSAELVAAGERAGRERILPAVSADPQVRAAHVATFVLRRPDGAQAVLVVAQTAEALQRGNEVIAATDLLPGEDPALLRDPDRVETFEVVHAFGADFTPIGSAPAAATPS